MRPTALDIHTQGDLGGESIDLTFDPHSIQHIMSVLTDLYSDQELAVIREYSTNAIDSHIEAKNTAPIEVTTPTALSPYLIIQDYGTGMSPDDVRNVYLMYGASTKRGTDEQTGMLGVGGKSALTYTDQFTVTAVRNGVKTLLNVARDETGKAVAQIVDTSGTNEPNGVQIKIPVNRNNLFESKAKDFFRFWKKGTVLLNGEEPKTIDGDWVSDSMVLAKGLGSDYIVMGNVPYPVSWDNCIVHRGYYNEAALVAFVPIGSVAFTPSREELRYDSVTMNMLSSIRPTLAKNISDALNDQIRSCKTAGQAFRMSIRFENEYSHIRGLKLSCKWQGKDVPTFVSLPCTEFKPDATRYQIGRLAQVSSYDYARGIVLITNTPDVQITSAHKAKIRRLLEDETLDVGKVLLVEEGTEISEWIEDVPTFDWDVVRKIKLNDSTTVNTGRRGVQHIQRVVKTQYGATLEDITELDPNEPIVYFSPTDDFYRDRISSLVQLFDENVQIIMLGANRFAKLQREFPNAKTARTAVHEQSDIFKNSVPDDVILTYNIFNRDQFVMYDETKIDDPDFAEAVKIAKNDISAWTKRASVVAATGGYNVLAKTLDNNPGKVYSRYKLLEKLRYSSHRPSDHTYIYINAAYHALYEGEEND